MYNHRSIIRRMKPARRQTTWSWESGRAINQRVQAAREQAFVRYVWRGGLR
jgi:hypothetical protein